MVRASVLTPGDVNSAMNAYCASTARARLRTKAWKYSSPVVREAASTIARSAVSSSLASCDESPAVIRLAAAFLEAFCVAAIATGLTARALINHFSGWQLEMGTLAHMVPRDF